MAKMKAHSFFQGLALLFLTTTLAGCVASTSRMGMVNDPKTGLMLGSTVQKSLTTDAAFYPNRKIKVRVRNTSGDPEFDLSAFKANLERAYGTIGYEPTADDDFGLMMDINVIYSGQIQNNMEAQFAVFGAMAGGVYGQGLDAKGRTNVGRNAGIVSGAAIGDIAGSFVTDDTYVVVASTTFGVRKRSGNSGKTITFSRSQTRSELDIIREEGMWSDGFRSTATNEIAAYAGGRNVAQSQISDQVRNRLVSILSGLI